MQLDLHVHALARGVDDVHQALVGADLVLIARILVDVRRGQDGETLLLGRQRDGATNLGAGALGRLHDLIRRAVDQAVIEGLQADTNFLVSHFSHFTILVTTPAPTVRPHSWLAKRSNRPQLSPAWPWASSLRNISTPVTVVFWVSLMPTISTSSPTLMMPRSTRPVTTVPRPEIEKTSSTGIRKAPSMARSGSGM